MQKALRRITVVYQVIELKRLKVFDEVIASISLLYPDDFIVET
jgi:hypothetical protein